MERRYDMIGYDRTDMVLRGMAGSASALHTTNGQASISAWAWEDVLPGTIVAFHGIRSRTQRLHILDCTYFT